MNKLEKTIKLNNGVEMPRLGIGVWKIENSKTSQVISWALKFGYRLIDTAKVYGNEDGVGHGIIKSGVPRKEIFVTTKLSIYDLLQPEKYFEESLEKLKLEYVDLYLIHHPFIGWQKAWKGLETIYKTGKARAIGVSNFNIEHLEELKKISNITPMVNEVELTPFLYRKELIDYCQGRGIAVDAYSPLSCGKYLDNSTILNIANGYHKSPAQIMIRWGLQHGLIIIPKSETESHIKENLNVFDFEIKKTDMEKLDMLNKNHSMMPLWSRG